MINNSNQIRSTIQKTFGDLAPGAWVVMGNDVLRVAVVRPNNGIVKVHLYRSGHTSLGSLISMSAPAAFPVTILDQQSKQGIPMDNINEVRSRLDRALDLGRAPGMAADIDALLADHARLQKIVNAKVCYSDNDASSKGGSDAVVWVNHCNRTVPDALRYLANHPRPSGGEARFNAAHLFQLADEIEHMASAPLYAVPMLPTKDEVE